MLSWLVAKFEQAQDRPALIWRDQTSSYGWLRRRIDYWLCQLGGPSALAGRVVALEADYSPDAVALLLALAHARAIIVPLTSATRSNKTRFRTIGQTEQVIAITSSEKIVIECTGTVAEHPHYRELRSREHAGLVFFSSGSTGEPKAAVHDFVHLIEKFKTPRHSLRAITFLLLDHIGGINTLLYNLSNLGTSVVVEDRSPDAVCATIARHAVELLPTTPTFLNLLLLSEAHRRHDLSSLRKISYGTEPMPQSTLKRLHSELPHVKLLQTYGMSELGILRSKSKCDDSLWVKIGGEGFETKVVNRILHVRAHCAMLGYLNAPSPFDADGWLCTGDEVEVDGEYFRILGRRSELINVGGEKVYPAEIESRLLEDANVREAVVVGEPNPITGKMVVAYVQLNQPEPPAELRKRLRAFCAERLEPFKVPAKIQASAERLHNLRFKKVRRLDPAVSNVCCSGGGK